MSTRLKSLDLQGYKTFASRTVFEFAGAVTCIVGPNGSGKSNIADSMRWVLGEQSYTLLRGKKTEDMIFAGSEQRPRAGMASATVVFDNLDGWLPIDFSEVAITRRAYRDGENEYLINGQKVRLKDVNELLAQSGLAERTYTIIGQGVVDAALALKPEERRRLFEEAAGIGLHRSRREEALRRLDNTRRNLERVQDILAELQPRVRSLDRQARRAREYEQVKEVLRSLLRDWYGYHWHRSQKDLSAARQMAQSKEKALSLSRREQETLSTQLSAARESMITLRSELNDWHRNQAQLHTQREALSRGLAIADERIRSYQLQEQELRGEIARLEEEAALQQERLNAAQDTYQALEAELAQAKSQAQVAQDELQRRQNALASAAAGLENARASLASLETEQGQLLARLDEQRSQLEGRHQALESAFQAGKKAETTLASVKENIESAAIAVKEAESARKNVEDDLASLRSRMDEIELSRKGELEHRARNQAEVAGLQAQIDVLEQAEASLSGYASGTKVLLRAVRESRLRGAKGALSSFLEVPDHLENSIAAALGEYLDALVLEPGADVDQALDLLGSESARGVLLPLEELSTGSRVKASGEDVLGVASDLVGSSAELRPVLDLLLGTTLVVQDRAAARRLVRSQSAGVRVVTLQGEIFYAGGAVVAGLEGKPASLSRPRQRREVENSMDAAVRELAGIAARLDGLAEEFSRQEVQAGKLGEQLVEKQKVESAARDAHSRLLVDLEQAERQLTWQNEQQQTIQEGIARLEEMSFQQTAEKDRLDKAISAAREVVRGMAAEIKGLSLDDFQAQYTYWNTLVEATGRSVVGAKTRLEEQGDALERSRSVQKAVSEKLESMQSNLQRVESERASQRQEEEAISKQIEALSLQIEPSELELQGAERSQDELQGKEASARQELTLAEHVHAQARIGLARAQEALDSLRQRIQDDFGLVSFDYVEDISGPTPLPLEGMVEELPRITKLPPELEENLKQQRTLLRRIGPVNPEAQAEYKEVKERFEFMTEQVADLEKAEVDVRQVIADLDDLMDRELLNTFDAVATEFSNMFTRLFGGGSARLRLTNPQDISSTGIDIEARLPGRRVQGLSLLSGGERSLTAAALIFALIKISPTPFCVLDEVDAMLDEANVGRFRDLLRELSQNTQFIVVTHNRNTVQVADVIYGVTMGRDSSSQIISLKMDEVSQVV